MAARDNSSWSERVDIPNPADVVSALISSRQLRRYSFRQRVILGVLAFLAVVVILLAGVLMVLSRQQALRFSEASLSRRSMMLAENISWAFNSTILEQHLFIDNFLARGWRTPEDFEREASKKSVKEELIAQAKMIPQQLNTILINKNGLFINGVVNAERAGLSLADRDYFQLFSKDSGASLTIVEIAKARITSKSTIGIAQAVRGDDGGLLGVIVSGFSQDYFESLFTANRPMGGGTVAVYRFDGRPLLFSSMDDPTVPPAEPSAELAEFMRSGADGAVVAESDASGSRRRLVSYHKIYGQQLAVAVSASIDTLMRDWRHEAVIFGSAVVFLEGIILSLAVLVISLARAHNEVLAERNVTELAERRELAAARELESLIQTIPGLVSRRRRMPEGNWKCLFVSSNLAEVSGFDPKEVVKADWMEGMIGPEQHALLCARLDRALAKGRSSLDVTMRLPTGKLHKLHAEIGRVGLAENATDVSIIWTDVTVERSFTAQLAQAAKLATLGEVATGMAHELSQPLATISLAAENAINLLERTPLDRVRMLGKLEMIAGMSGRTATLLDHMRVFGRADDGVIVALSMHDVAMRAGLLLARRLTCAAVTLKTELPADLPLVWASEVPLEQVVINIVGNACDAYSLAGEAIPQDQRVVIIKGHYDRDGQRVVITVQDKAGGIPNDTLPYIFEQFFTTKPADQGTGLGLSISKRVIGELGGTIWVENQDGGAVFYFTIPVANSRVS